MINESVVFLSLFLFCFGMLLFLAFICAFYSQWLCVCVCACMCACVYVCMCACVYLQKLDSHTHKSKEFCTTLVPAVSS